MRAALLLVLFLAAGVARAQLQITVVPVAASSLVYDPVSKKIYASVGSGGRGAQANSITAINPRTGEVGPSVYIGSEPRGLVLSAASKYLYVAVSDGRSVRRFDLATMEPGPQFPVGAGLALTALAMMPGDPEAVVVMRHRPGVSPNDEGVAIYVGGVPKPGVVHAGHHLAVGINPYRLYGYENQISSWDFVTMNLTPQGVEGAGSTGSLLSGNIGLTGTANGLIVTNNGNVIDPEARQQVGKLGDTGLEASLCPDGTTGRVFRIAGERDNFQLVVYDLRTFRIIGTIPLPGVRGGGGNLIRWADGLAFTTDAGVVLLQGEIGARLPLVDLSVRRSPLPDAPSRDGQLRYTLTVTNTSAFAASGAFLTDALPGGFDVLETKASQGSALASGGIVRAELGRLDAGASATVDVTLQRTAAEAALAFTAVVRSHEPDPATGNNINLIRPATALPGALPDLVGAWGRVQQVAQGAGANLRATLLGTFEVRNAGTQASVPTTLRFYVSESPLFDASFSQLLQEAAIPALRRGSAYRVLLEAPLGPGGDVTGLYVFGVIDASNAVEESDKKNNVARARVP